jgi:hypothetical protein
MRVMSRMMMGKKKGRISCEGVKRWSVRTTPAVGFTRVAIATGNTEHPPLITQP